MHACMQSLHTTDTSSLSVHVEREEVNSLELHWRITKYRSAEQSTWLSNVGLLSIPNLYDKNQTLAQMYA